MRKSESAKRALLVSFLSRAWVAGLGFLAIPIYLRFLGVEAYGVVGVFTSISMLVGFLDLGLGPALTREMSRLPGGQIQLTQARDIARTFELAYLTLAVLVGLLGVILAWWLGMKWVAIETLNRTDVTWALCLASIALACQWPGILYGGGLGGLQRQTVLGIATTVTGTFRILLVLCALWIEPSLQAFFSAQIVATLLHTIALRMLFWSSLSRIDAAPKFRWTLLRRSLVFSGGMTGIAITSIVLTQTDKLILSHVLSLSEFGIYAVASVLASSLYLAISPIFAVMYPRFAALVHQGREQDLAAQYQVSTQLMAVLIVPVTALMAAFGYEALFLWTGNVTLARAGGLTLSLLVIGNACNGLMNIPYALQLAHGWTALAFGVNMILIFFMVPGIWWMSTRYGAIGGAAAWAIFNLSLVVISPQIMHRRLLLQEMGSWYRVGLVLPVAICSCCVAAFKLIPLDNLSRPMIVVIFGGYLIAMSLILVVALPQVRRRVFKFLMSGRVGA